VFICNTSAKKCRGTKWNSGRILIDVFNAAQKCAHNFMPILDEVWFTLSENMNTENDESCCYKNVSVFCDIPLLDLKLGSGTR